MSVLILNNKRILLKDIKSYELRSDKLYHRNDKEEQRFLFIWTINKDELWSEYSFDYLYLKMINGKYKLFSDNKLDELMEEMEIYLEGIPEEDEHVRKAVKSYERIRDNFIFVNEDILDITDRIDHAFGTI